MTFDEYQVASRSTAVYQEQVQPLVGDLGVLLYLACGLSEEAGEVAGCVKKALRDQEGRIEPDVRDRIASEIGDVLWYATQLAAEIGIPLDAIAMKNVAKLQARKERGTISGEGER